MSLRIRNQRDFAAGVMFLAFGLVGAIVGRGYEMGTAGRMGPGYFPALLSGGLILFGIIIGFRGLAFDGETIERMAFRPLLAVVGSVAVFGLTLDRLGLVVAVALVTLIMAFATTSRRWVEVIVSAAVMSLFCVLVFVVGLDQQMKIWGWQ
ncbi:tripartite tricarboxylate transporter TctB family protein [Rhizobium rhizogenes]|uniref:tripartite tricarboxylate transporter TctB family protein n=1 Tax=Rhizobium rhizogenes TaxID=359 RepID=UPI00157299D7|nr:tripartite tricarboxylate transporter TctB family protein [Rhizobium rhizogenes]NTI78478.1 tripartite tricarboxylate transporter TctB family protein [Rhizobium rhizogenes]